MRNNNTRGNRVNYNFDNFQESKQETGSLSHRTNKSILTAGTKSVGNKSVGTKSILSDSGQKNYNQSLKQESINKNGKLVDYIKHDSALGRD